MWGFLHPGAYSGGDAGGRGRDMQAQLLPRPQVLPKPQVTWQAATPSSSSTKRPNSAPTGFISRPPSVSAFRPLSGGTTRTGKTQASSTTTLPRPHTAEAPPPRRLWQPGDGRGSGAGALSTPGAARADKWMKDMKGKPGSTHLFDTSELPTPARISSRDPGEVAMTPAHGRRVGGRSYNPRDVPDKVRGSTWTKGMIGSMGRPGSEGSLPATMLMEKAPPGGFIFSPVGSFSVDPSSPHAAGLLRSQSTPTVAARQVVDRGVSGCAAALDYNRKYQAVLLEQWKRDAAESEEAIRQLVSKAQISQFFDFLKVGGVTSNASDEDLVPCAMECVREVFPHVEKITDLETIEAEFLRPAPEVDLTQVVELNPAQAVSLKGIFKKYIQASRSGREGQERMSRATFCRFLVDSRLVALEGNFDARVPYQLAVRHFDILSAGISERDGKVHTHGIGRSATLDQCVVIVGQILGKMDLTTMGASNAFENGLSIASNMINNIVAEMQREAQPVEQLAMERSSDEAMQTRRLEWFAKWGTPPTWFSYPVREWTRGLQTWLNEVNKNCMPEVAMERHESNIALINFLRDSLLEPAVIYSSTKYVGLFRMLFQAYSDEHRLKRPMEADEDPAQINIVPDRLRRQHSFNTDNDSASDASGFSSLDSGEERPDKVQHMSFGTFFRFCVDFGIFPTLCCFEQIRVAYSMSECGVLLRIEEMASKQLQAKAEEEAERRSAISRSPEEVGSEEEQDRFSHFSRSPRTPRSRSPRSPRTEGDMSGLKIGHLHLGPTPTPEKRRGSRQTNRRHSAIDQQNLGLELMEEQAPLRGRCQSDMTGGGKEKEAAGGRSGSILPIMAATKVLKKTRDKRGVTLAPNESPGDKNRSQNTSIAGSLQASPAPAGIMRKTLPPERLAQQVQALTVDFARRGSRTSARTTPRGKSKNNSLHASRQCSVVVEEPPPKIKQVNSFKWIEKPFAQMNKEQFAAYSLLVALDDCRSDYFTNVRGIIARTGVKNVKGVLEASTFYDALEEMHVMHPYDRETLKAFINAVDPQTGDDMLDAAELEKALDKVEEDRQRRNTGQQGAGRISKALGEEVHRDRSEVATNSEEAAKILEAQEMAFGYAAFTETLLLLGLMHMHGSPADVKATAPAGIKCLWMIAYLRMKFTGLVEEEEKKKAAALEKSQAGEQEEPAPPPPEQPQIERRVSRQRGRVEKKTICSCGNVFMPDAKFCRNCGAKRPQSVTVVETLEVEDSESEEEEQVVCSTCSNALMPDAKFCRKCGAKRPEKKKKEKKAKVFDPCWKCGLTEHLPQDCNAPQPEGSFYRPALQRLLLSHPDLFEKFKIESEGWRLEKEKHVSIQTMAAAACAAAVVTKTQGQGDRLTVSTSTLRIPGQASEDKELVTSRRNSMSQGKRGSMVPMSRAQERSVQVQQPKWRITGDAERLPGTTCSSCGRDRDESAIGDMFCHCCSGVDETPLCDTLLYPIFCRRGVKMRMQLFEQKEKDRLEAQRIEREKEQAAAHEAALAEEEARQTKEEKPARGRQRTKGK
eukprot:TRINITY_DN2322_c0_g3_i1.p1 TRINITY_DN2322_c0_g3~~TRINITY_DN2322_c0_g3_i1.p1  ORF type:complete len:1536 (-),score=403.60 TRINITY_DN2322_c0_g3_i1:207-4814(-)